MTRYYPLYVRRSDGKLETVHGKKKEKNEPTLDQLNDTPDSNGVSDYYRPIAEDEPKHLDWRRKLGGMLMRELAGPGSEHQRESTSFLFVRPAFTNLPRQGMHAGRSARELPLVRAHQVARPRWGSPVS